MPVTVRSVADGAEPVVSSKRTVLVEPSRVSAGTVKVLVPPPLFTASVLPRATVNGPEAVTGLTRRTPAVTAVVPVSPSAARQVQGAGAGLGERSRCPSGCRRR